MSTNTRTVDRLRSLIRLYDQASGQHPVVDQVVDKLFEMEIQRARQDVEALLVRLKAYEQQYGMSSAEFYSRFRAGTLGDTADFVEWSAFWDMWQAAHQRLDELTAQTA